MAKQIKKKKVTKKSATGKTGAKKKTGVKKTAKKKTTKTSTPKTKSTVKTTAKKKTGVKKTIKKKTTKTSAPKKKSTVKTTAKKKATAKKAVGKKAATKKATTTKKPKDTKARKKKTKALKKSTSRVFNLKKEITIDDVASIAEARAKAIKDIKGYSKKDLEHFKNIILEKQDEIVKQLQNLKEQMLDPTTGEYINENSPYSLHMAEQGTDAMEREKIFLYAQRENKFLGYLEDALKRIESGTYGICLECIDEPQHLCGTCPLIPKERLEAVPHSQLCLPIKQRQEKKQ